MITRQSCYSAIFRLKSVGVDVTVPLKMMQETSDIPEGVIEFLRDQSPQFQFYRSIQKHQRALMKNILHYDELDNKDKIKVASSFITRAVISVEYNNLDESLLDELGLDKIAHALDKALSDRDYSKLDEVFKMHQDAMKLFYKGVSENGC